MTRVPRRYRTPVPAKESVAEFWELEKDATSIDFKTGRVGHLADKYLSQMPRYRTILHWLFQERPAECYLLFVDKSRADRGNLNCPAKGAFDLLKVIGSREGSLCQP